MALDGSVGHFPHVTESQQFCNSQPTLIRTIISGLSHSVSAAGETRGVWFFIFPTLPTTRCFEAMPVLSEQMVFPQRRQISTSLGLDNRQEPLFWRVWCSRVACGLYARGKQGRVVLLLGNVVFPSRFSAHCCYRQRTHATTCVLYTFGTLGLVLSLIWESA